MTVETALETRDLTKRYRRGRTPALESVTLALPRGTFVALVGPNGAGKSTLIRTFLGFERPTAGSAHVLGIDVRRDTPRALGQLGYVGQAPGIYSVLTARDQIALAAELRPGFDAAGALRRLADAGIPDNRPGGQLSGGQQAQLALALALGTQAPVLLLDEPLASLDPLARREFLGTVAAAVAGGTTVLLSSHIVGDLDEVCDRLIVLAPARVQLDAEMAWARAHHRLVPLAEAGGLDMVGSFANRRGVHTALVRTEEPSADSPRLDDIVLGYLAAARRPEAAA
ncbi:MAG: ATP-binding cassette domain-containing protein [Candidatus Limnocylindrales bacterium]